MLHLWLTSGRLERKYGMIDLDCDEILKDKLWVGSYIRAAEVRALRRLGFTTVLSLQSNQDLDEYNVSFEELLEAYQQAGIELRRLPIPDFDKQALAANLSRGVEELEKALSPKSAKVYVHCTAGINRGPTLAAAYLVKTRRLSAEEARSYVVARRHCNPYLDTLEAYAASLEDNPPT